MVDPILKQDLTLVKNAFEEKALEKSGNAALLPMKEALVSQRLIHNTVIGQAKRYPSVSSKSKDPNNSLLKKIQTECIPCQNRIKALGELDMAGDIFSAMMVYNGRALKNLINLFTSLTYPNRMQENLCMAYKALRANCIPDLRRLIAALSFMLADLRSINLKSLKNQMLGLVVGIIARTIISTTINLDMYVKLITDTLNCVLADVKLQISKLDPILSRDGLTDTVDRLTPLSRSESKAKVDSWFNDTGYTGDLSKQVSSTQQQLNKTITSGFDDAVKNMNDFGRILTSMIDEAVGRVDKKLDNASKELLRFLKLSDGNLKSQIEVINQIILITSVIQLIQTIMNTRGDWNPCGEEAGRNFFISYTDPRTKVYITPPGDKDDPGDIEIVIVPKDIIIKNPVVDDILNNAGIITRSIDPLDTSTKVLDLETPGIDNRAIPISIRVSECLGINNG